MGALGSIFSPGERRPYAFEHWVCPIFWIMWWTLLKRRWIEINHYLWAFPLLKATDKWKLQANKYVAVPYDLDGGGGERWVHGKSCGRNLPGNSSHRNDRHWCFPAFQKNPTLELGWREYAFGTFNFSHRTARGLANITRRTLWWMFRRNVYEGG